MHNTKQHYAQHYTTLCTTLNNTMHNTTQHYTERYPQESCTTNPTGLLAWHRSSISWGDEVAARHWITSSLNIVIYVFLWFRNMYFSDSVSHISLFIFSNARATAVKRARYLKFTYLSTIVSNSSSSINPPSRSRNTVERMGKIMANKYFLKIIIHGGFWIFLWGLRAFQEISGDTWKFHKLSTFQEFLYE